MEYDFEIKIFVVKKIAIEAGGLRMDQKNVKTFYF